MKIEILYEDLCCLYGDKGNTMLLRKCLPEAAFIHTGLNDTPAFLSGDVDLCYLCSMSEQSQELVLSRLMPYAETIRSMAREGKTLFLVVGNALELLGRYIQREDGSKVEALGLYDIYAVRQTPNRFNSLMKGEFEGMTLLGYTSRFSHTFGITEEIAMQRIPVGAGQNPKSQIEGIRSGRVLATYMNGPLLVANPDFTLWLLRALNAGVDKLPGEAALRQAYEVKRKDFDRDDLEMA